MNSTYFSVISDMAKWDSAQKIASYPALKIIPLAKQWIN